VEVAHPAKRKTLIRCVLATSIPTIAATGPACNDQSVFMVGMTNTYHGTLRQLFCMVSELSEHDDVDDTYQRYARDDGRV